MGYSGECNKGMTEGEGFKRTFYNNGRSYNTTTTKGKGAKASKLKGGKGKGGKGVANSLKNVFAK